MIALEAYDADILRERISHVAIAHRKRPIVSAVPLHVGFRAGHSSCSLHLGG
jgi:hypothetical protein